MFTIVTVSQRVLDAMFEDCKEEDNRPCPDCGVTPGRLHDNGCDVARCKKTKGQRLMCGCGECGEDKWEALWPGIKEAYENRYVVFDSATNTVMFDLNRVAMEGL